MKRRNYFRLTLELIVIIGYLVLGVTIFSFYYNSPRVPFDQIFVGSLVLAMGVLELTEFITWKYAMKMRSMASFVASIVAIGLGFVFMFVKMKATVLCTLWGIFSIVFSLVKISTGSINLVYQPLISSVRIIVSITRIVFSILLLVRNPGFTNSFILFLGIVFAIEALTLFIEFMIHRYQRI